MTRNVTFLHAADIHLGAPMRGFRDLSEAWSKRLQQAIAQSFDRVIDEAIRNDVDFVVIAGDAFDTSHASYGDFLLFFQGLNRLDQAGIPTYLIAGNHDPYTVWQHDLRRLPDSAQMLGCFGPEFTLFEREGEPLCLIGARGYHNQAWPIDEPIAAGITRNAAVQELKKAYPQAVRAPFSIGIIHTGLDIDQSKAYSDPQVLLSADIDYWACGHLHMRYALPSESDPRIVFPGCVQGRDIRESGDRGCYLVTLEEAPGSHRPRVSLNFVSTASVAFQTISVDVEPCQTLADVVHLVQAKLFHENAKVGCDEMVVRVVLTGNTSLHEFLVLPEVICDLRKRLNGAYPTFFCDAVVNRTKAPASFRRTNDELFESHVAHIASEQGNRKAEMVDFLQAEFVKRGIDVPSSLSRRIGDFNDAAETMVLDLLSKERQ